MSVAITSVLALALAGANTPGAQERSEEVGCIVCHGAEARGLSLSVHAAGEVSCVTCHGGDPTSMDEELAHGDALRSLADRRDAVDSCAECHSDPARMGGFALRTDQALLYRASPHGKALFEQGDAGVATCTDCHGAHDVFAATDPRSPTYRTRQPETCGRCHEDADAMERHELSPAVVGEYRDSVHGKALLERGVPSSPACTDCHGSHSTQPPGVRAIGRVCGKCHAVERAFLEDGPHLAPIQADEMTECLDCHGAHAIGHAGVTLLSGAEGGLCGVCHEGSEDPARLVAASMRAALGRFDDDLRDAEEASRAAAERGLFLDRESGFIADARSVRARAGSLVHTASLERLEALLSRGEGMLEETYVSLDFKGRRTRDRRIFTAVFFGVTLLLVGVLQVYRVEVLKGRRNRSRRRRQGRR